MKRFTNMNYKCNLTLLITLFVFYLSCQILCLICFIYCKFNAAPVIDIHVCARSCYVYAKYIVWSNKACSRIAWFCSFTLTEVCSELSVIHIPNSPIKTSDIMTWHLMLSQRSPTHSFLVCLFKNNCIMYSTAKLMVNFSSVQLVTLGHSIIPICSDCSFWSLCLYIVLLLLLLLLLPFGK